MKKFLLLTPVVTAALCLAQAPLAAQNQPAPEAVPAAAMALPSVGTSPAADMQPGAPVTVQAAAMETVAAQAPAAGMVAPASAVAEGEGFVAVREEVASPSVKAVSDTVVVTYNPKVKRDPTLSPDDFLLLQYREQQRLAAVEAEKQRKLAEERRKREEAERLRQLELARIKDPTREVRNKIHVGGIIGQEVFVGSRIYTVGKSLYGARIVEVRPDEVVFSYKGHKFTRKVQLK